MQDNTTSSMSQELRDHQLTIRIPQRIRDALDAQAEAEHRTVADVLNNMLAKLYPISATADSRRR
jgi:hypothetical protein